MKETRLRIAVTTILGLFWLLTACGSQVRSVGASSSTSSALAKASKEAGFVVKVPRWMPPGGRILLIHVFLPTASQIQQSGGGEHFKRVFILIGGGSGSSSWRIQLYEQWTNLTLVGPGVTKVTVEGVELFEQSHPNPYISGNVVLNAPSGVAYSLTGVDVPLQELVRSALSVIH